MVALTELLEVLGSVSPNEYWAMEKDWKAFVENPKKYQGTATEACVRQWLLEFRDAHKDERFEVGGINWMQYHTYTREEAEKWFEELTGTKPAADTIGSPIKRTPAGEYDHMFWFRLHR